LEGLNELLAWYEVGETRDLGDLGTCHTELLMYKHDDKHREEYVECSNELEIKSYGPEETGLTMITKTTFSDGRDPITNEHFHAYPKVWGKGAWTAVTLDDAKQMASDFAEGVS